MNSGNNDIDEIFSFYKIATDFQKTKFSVQWPEFDDPMKCCESDIEVQKLYKFTMKF